MNRITLPNDVARCDGYSDDEGGTWEECETCLRRTASRDEEHSMITPPLIVAFQCEFLIEPK